MSAAEDFAKLIEPRDHVDRDLMQLAGKRTSEASTSVLQLAEDPEQAMRILLAAFTTACAGLAVVYLEAQGRHGDADGGISQVERLNIGIEAMKALRDQAMRTGR